MSYVIDGKPVNLKITYKEAMFDLKSKFGLNLLGMFKDEGFEKIAQIIMLDDEIIIDIWWHFLQKDSRFSTLEESLVHLDNPETSIDKFREALWEEITNFFGHQKRDLLKKMWSEMQTQIEKNFQNLSLSASSSP